MKLPSTNTTYPATPTLSTDGSHENTAELEPAVTTRFAGVDGASVSGVSSMPVITEIEEIKDSLPAESTADTPNTYVVNAASSDRYTEVSVVV